MFSEISLEQFQALDSVMIRNLRKGAVVLIGDNKDFRLCTIVYKETVLRNWPSHGFIKFVRGKKYYYRSGTVSGRQSFLFRETYENQSSFERINYERKISAWVNNNSTTTGDMVAVANLILEDENKKPIHNSLIPKFELYHRANVKRQILKYLERLSIKQLRQIWELIILEIAA